MQWEGHVKEAERLISQGQFEKAISYLTEQIQGQGVHDVDKLVDALHAFNLTVQYSDPKQALFIIKPVYDAFVKKYEVEGCD